jgi:3-oxoacyl-[acyl-carrier protein] reductase/meso-butanediol dehydrogenase/(S,S)-butanediol dehydrogenase/diacetyl reductase
MSASRTLIITGGTKGIGAGIAKRFADEGWRVVVGARNDNGFATTLDGRGRFIAMDVTRETDHNKAAKVALDWTGRLDCWINAAGRSAWRPIGEIDEAFWRDMIAVNLTGAMWGCKAAAAAFTGPGAIINVSSLAGKRGSANNSVYCAAKFGLNGMTQALAKELGPRNIRINAVCPVYVVTPGLHEALDDPRSPLAGGRIEPFLADFAKSQAALQRLPTDREVADLCLYLASDAASAVTAQCINVDCGVMPQ